mmetsp:Transcript_6045/g.7898  ORF Transcript_6045/g.7898 Transcript_6045/m.7898 type:complete len:672 (+) Transcript_6045:73-2088(+)
MGYCSTVSKYRKIRKVGQGTYGQVWKAKDKGSGRIVALKRIRLHEIYKHENCLGMPLPCVREIRVLVKCRHENLAEMIEVVTSKNTARLGAKSSMYLVFEYFDHDLSGLITHKYKFTREEVKCFFYQLACGIRYLHSKNICHRDLKSSNLLISSSHVLKITDFGLSRELTKSSKDGMVNSIRQGSKGGNRRYTTNVITLWYRPPELLLGNSEYNFAVDMWSVGCILAELLLCNAIFPGKNETDQLRRILNICGVRDLNSWKDAQRMPNYTVLKKKGFLKKVRGNELDELLNEYALFEISKECRLLLRSLLMTNPLKRKTAKGVIESRYLTSEPKPLRPCDLPEMKLEHESLHEFEAKKIVKQGSLNLAEKKAGVKRVERESVGQDRNRIPKQTDSLNTNERNEQLSEAGMSESAKKTKRINGGTRGTASAKQLKKTPPAEKAPDRIVKDSGKTQSMREDMLEDGEIGSPMPENTPARSEGFQKSRSSESRSNAQRRERTSRGRHEYQSDNESRNSKFRGGRSKEADRSSGQYRESKRDGWESTRSRSDRPSEDYGKKRKAQFDDRNGSRRWSRGNNGRESARHDNCSNLQKRGFCELSPCGKQHILSDVRKDYRDVCFDFVQKGNCHKDCEKWHPNIGTRKPENRTCFRFWYQGVCKNSNCKYRHRQARYH